MPRIEAWWVPVVLAAAPSLGAAQVHPEIVIACDESGKLVVRFDSKPYPLPASRFPWVEGYADAMPGCASLLEAKPAEGLFPPDPASSLGFVLEGADDGAAVWNDHGTGTMRVGETFSFGNPPFDSHPVWTIAKGAPRKAHALRMRIRDASGRHRESEVFAPSFLPDDGTTAYSCPMSCRGGMLFPQPGRCAECGMALKLLSGRAYRVTVAPEGDPRIRAGRETTLRFRVDAPDGKQEKSFEVVHEKLLHLLMVSSDLSWFAHEHPEIQPDGSFTLKTTFPHGGEFTLYHDFTPERVGMQVVPVAIEVAGDVPPRVALTPGSNRAQTPEGFAVELTAASPLRSIRMQRLTFRLSRAGAPVTDLEPFLGAMGHLIVISHDRKQFVHSHPLETKTGGRARTGPEVVFSAQFPVPGLYKAWGQFQHAGRVITAPFVIQVVSPREGLVAPTSAPKPTGGGG